MKHHSKIRTAFGVSGTQTYLARKFGVAQSSVSYRLLKRGMTIEEAITDLLR